MATTRIIDLTEATALQSDDFFVIDSSRGTKKIGVGNVLDDTLTEEGKFADAKATGDAIDAVGDKADTNAENIATNTSDIADVKSDLTAEQTARENADTALQTAINAKADSTELTAEQTARQNADSNLQTYINNEKTAREAYGFSVVNGILNVTYTTTEVGGE